jgi:hypothetical protein
VFDVRINHLLRCVLITAVTVCTLGFIGNRVNVKADSIDVDTTNVIRPVGHVASGGLQSMSDGSTPSADLITPLKPILFTVDPMNAQQLSNKQPTPVGQFDKVAPLVDKVGGKMMVRLPEIYNGWPYHFSNMADWLAKVDQMVRECQSSPYAKDIYGYELWNEPNGTWFGPNGNGHNNGWPDFYDLWNQTFEHVRAIAPNARIVGPSINSWQPKYMSDFLTMAKKNGTLPNVISWHVWGAAAFPQEDAQFNQLEDKLGIAHLPLSLNEYGADQDLAVPGKMIHYVQSFENAKDVESACLAYWYNAGRMNNLLTDQQKPNGGYWLFKWYGDMSGDMVTTSTRTTNGELASIANINDNQNQASVIFGGTSGDNTINVSGLNPSKFGNSVNIKVEETPWYGVDTAVASPKVTATGAVPINNGSISVPVKNMTASYGYRLVITPSSSTNNSSNITYVSARAASDPIRVEAENSKLTGTAVIKQGSYASNDKYVGYMNTPESSITFTANALAAGNYKVEIGYANGDQSIAADHVALNGSKLADASFPWTHGWTNADPNYYGTRKVTQYGTVSLNKGDNSFVLSQAIGTPEIDYAQFTPIDQNTSGGNVIPNPSQPTSITATSSSSSSSSSAVPSSSSSSTNVNSTNNQTTSTNASTTKVKKSRPFLAYTKHSIYMYRQASFKQSQRVGKLAKHTTFKVVGAARSKSGILHYKLSNGHYVTANHNLVAPAYWQSEHATMYVKTAKGAYEYHRVSLVRSSRVLHLKKGASLKVKRVINHGLTTRLQLINGYYVSGSKRLVSVTKP